jgi:predicted acyltransferase (DUF342 family)
MDLLDDQDYTLDNDKFKLEIVSIPSPSIPSFILIHSTGIINDGGSLESRVKITYSLNITYSPFQEAIYGSGDITLDNNAMTDSYDSSVGVYGGSNVGSNGDVTTESDSISLANNAVINGDQETNASSDFTPACFPTTLPEGAEDLSDYLPDLNATLGSDNEFKAFRASQVKLDNNVQISIRGKVELYVEQDLTLSNNASIVLLSGATLSIYVKGNILFDNVSQGLVDSAPGDFIIYGTSNTGIVEIKNDSIVYAAIYAPDYFIKLDNRSELFGSVTGDQVHLSNDSRVHFDEALTKQVVDACVPPQVDEPIIQY